jgi:hypothetical protein
VPRISFLYGISIYMYWNRSAIATGPDRAASSTHRSRL